MRDGAPPSMCARAHHVEALLGDLDEARGAAEPGDPVHAVRVDLDGRVHVVGVGSALVERVVPQRHEHRAARVGVDAAQVAARRGSTARACSCPGSRPRSRRRGATSRSGCRRPVRAPASGRPRSGSVRRAGFAHRRVFLVRGSVQPSSVDVEVVGCRSRSRSAAAPCSGRTARRCSGACRARRTGCVCCQSAIVCSTDGRSSRPRKS